MRPSTASTPLSSSALNYLESLATNSRALRGNNNRAKDESSNSFKTNSSSVPVKRRESISDIISQVRRQSSLSRTDSEDFDFLNESLKSSVFDESDSSEEETPRESQVQERILPLGTPGAQVGRKSLKDIRELRNSIDQSLIKTPETKMLRNKVTTDESKKLKHFESIREEEVSEEIPKPQLPVKSPFKKAIQSGSDSSDADSIVFDEVFEEVLPSPPRKPAPVRAQTSQIAKTTPQKPVVKEESKKKKEKTPTPSSTSESESSSDSSSESSSSASESSSSGSSSSKASSIKKTYGSDFESSKSSSSSSSSSSEVSKASSVKHHSHEKRPKEPKKPSPVPYQDFIPKVNSSSESSKSTVRATNRTLEESLKIEKAKKVEDQKERKKSEIDEKVILGRRKSHRSSSSSSSAVGETEKEYELFKRRERRKSRSRRRRSEEPPTCQANVHNMVESVIDTHVQMLDEFNKMEYAAVCEWTQVLRQFDRHDGPTSERLREIVQRRLNRKY